MVDDVSRMSDATELMVSNLSSNQSYKNMKKTRKLTMGAFKEILKEKHLSNDAIESCCDDYATWTIERDMNNMKKLASCPTGYLVVFFCDCKRVNRRSSAWCRCGRKHITSCDTDGCAARSVTYQEGSCVHLDRGIAPDECVQYFAYYPVWNCLFDLIQANADEFFTCCTRKQIAQHIIYDDEHDILSSVSSLNSLSAYVALGEGHLASLVRNALAHHRLPLEQRCFLHPDPVNSLEKKLEKKSVDDMGE